MYCKGLRRYYEQQEANKFKFDGLEKFTERNVTYEN